MLRLSEIWGWGNCFSGRIDVNLGGGQKADSMWLKNALHQNSCPPGTLECDHLWKLCLQMYSANVT